MFPRHSRAPSRGLFGGWPAATALACAGLLAGIAIPRTAPAQELRYVDDRLVVTLRESPGADGPRIADLVTGDAVLLLDPPAESPDGGGYVRVRLDDGTEGWLPAQHLVPDPPASLRLQEQEDTLQILAIEKEQLGQQLRAVELDRRALEERVGALERARADLVGEVQRLQTEAERRAAGAGDRDAAERVVADLEEESRLLRIRNRELRESRDQRWFIAGGAIAVVCVLLGVLASRLGPTARSTWR